MTPQEHYAEAERLLSLVAKTSEDVSKLTVADHGGVARVMDTLLRQAHVHAVLALAGTQGAFDDTAQEPASPGPA